MSDKEGKARQDILEWKDKNQTAEKPDNTTWRDKLKYIGERRKTLKIPRHSQAIQTKKVIPK